MLRSLLTTAVLLTAASLTRADGPAFDGNWILWGVTPTAESALAIVKAETKDGKLTGSVVFAPPRGQAANAPKLEVRDLAVKGKDVSFATRQGAVEYAFTGTLAADGKEVLGSYGPDARPQRAKLTPTDKDTLTREEQLVRKPAEAYTKAITAQNRPFILQIQVRQEKDEDKKKELTEQIKAARKDAETEVPKLYRQVLADAATTPAAYDAALALLRAGSKGGVTADEATKLLAVLDKQAAPYGPRFVRTTLVQSADTLSHDKGLAAAAVAASEKITATLTDADTAAFQVQVLSAYVAALENAGQTAKLKEVNAKLTKLDAMLDREYLESVPPFRPGTFTARKDKAANRVVVLELFTGAQCPPCVAADVAFDALEKTYKPTDVVLLQYHEHIPGPDALTNPDTVARWDYYRELAPEGVRGTPTTVFNGKPQAGGGGGMPNAEKKYQQYRDIIDPLLEESTPVALKGSATRTGDQIAVTVNVTGAGEKKGLKLRVVVVEENIKYVGGNKLRFHHHVVRATPGGTDGFAIKEASSSHTAKVDVGQLRKDLTKYLDKYEADQRPFPTTARPLDMAHLKVVALVQDDKTGEILQAAQFDIGEKSAANR
ncbi:Omp28-related outer membrane protein [Limnoglobus roseus]|uniref:Thioredoxin domain-containing protein n=1 Tax=Limnoglobus roseus TaxID=2598579 RepID=A0A5C1A8B9_9BACT|nr:Omp28-related outer membrane protein [Limnoglobus roseus]QEL13408.1 hypothetical protein PX52LOC_00263 [Limnoglobus roseus]